MTMVPGLVTDTVVAPGTARRSKPSTRSPVVWMPTAPHTRAAVSPRAATMAATQYPAVDGRVLAWSGGMDRRVGGGRSSVSEEVMSFVSFSSPFTLLQIWPTVRSQRALIREAPWSPVHPVHCLGRPPRRSEDDGMVAALLGGLLWSPLALAVGVSSEPPRRRVSTGGYLTRQHNRASIRRGPRPAGMTAVGPPPLPGSWWWRLPSAGGWAAFR